jgi:hypothetical protein
MKKTVLIFSFFYLALLELASAHGGEGKEGLTNLQVMLISLSLCVIFYVIWNKITNKESEPNKTILLTLVVYTGSVHILLGINDFTLLLGGIGVLSIAGVSSLTNFGKEKEEMMQIMLGLIIVTMFVAYFVSNHDLHYIVEDYLGITTKLVEVGIIAFIIKNYKNQSKSNDS